MQRKPQTMMLWQIFAISGLLAVSTISASAEEAAPVKVVKSNIQPKMISNPPAPERQNDDTFWDFGKVREGKVLKHRFFIKNTTEAPFKITKVNTSCACTVSTVDTEVVQPGKKVPIEVRFDTKGYPGGRTRYTYVHTDSKKVGILVFEIRADVLGEASGQGDGR